MTNLLHAVDASGHQFAKCTQSGDQYVHLLELWVHHKLLGIAAK